MTSISFSFFSLSLTLSFPLAIHYVSGLFLFVSTPLQPALLLPLPLSLLLGTSPCEPEHTHTHDFLFSVYVQLRPALLQHTDTHRDPISSSSFLLLLALYIHMWLCLPPTSCVVSSCIDTKSTGRTVKHLCWAIKWWSLKIPFSSELICLIK